MRFGLAEILNVVQVFAPAQAVTVCYCFVQRTAVSKQKCQNPGKTSNTVQRPTFDSSSHARARGARVCAESVLSVLQFDLIAIAYRCSAHFCGEIRVTTYWVDPLARCRAALARCPRQTWHSMAQRAYLRAREHLAAHKKNFTANRTMANRTRVCLRWAWRTASSATPGPRGVSACGEIGDAPRALQCHGRRGPRRFPSLHLSRPHSRRTPLAPSAACPEGGCRGCRV